MTAPVRHPRHPWHHRPSPSRSSSLGPGGKPRPRAIPSTTRRAGGSILTRLVAANRRLEDSWLGDAIGAAFLFGAGYGLFVIAGVLG